MYKEHGIACCFVLCPPVGFALYSLFVVLEDDNAKLLAPSALFLQALSAVLFLFFFNASGEKTGSLARSASFTNSTRS